MAKRSRRRLNAQSGTSGTSGCSRMRSARANWRSEGEAQSAELGRLGALRDSRGDSRLALRLLRAFRGCRLPYTDRTVSASRARV
jgi:hypothetical protein